jgi:hypothetical protein
LVGEQPCQQHPYPGQRLGGEVHEVHTNIKREGESHCSVMA